MDPTKLAGIKDWEAPKTVKGKYMELAKLLHNSTKKNTVFEWTKHCQIAFDVLKAKFLQQLILKMPNDQQLFVIEADMLKWAMGAVLCQKGPDGEFHPCGYIYHAFTPVERNYKIYD
uniref:Reverse transcriptase/retrotransposon-derived protein RNase H-like domain-containing protein n=1 Tax=Moniliophthora roreri TaxID=221103 RepID=A0A0W0EXY0_MONRR